MHDHTFKTSEREASRIVEATCMLGVQKLKRNLGVTEQLFQDGVERQQQLQQVFESNKCLHDTHRFHCCHRDVNESSCCVLIGLGVLS
jgi:hypothetical protein